MICSQCKGLKLVKSNGWMQKDCPICKGTGAIDDISTQQTAGKQDEIACTKDTERQNKMDQSAPKSRKRIRRHVRKKCEVGSSAKDIQERKESAQDNEKKGCEQINE